LREGGEQGWLSATFTPKGKQHWTHETFATGRPNTAIFRARTQDNPFLPPGFHGTIRLQYTSALSAQELEGEFVDLAGALFRRDWFQIMDQAPPTQNMIRAWDLAATPKDQDKANDPDWTAGVLMGRSVDGTFCVLDVRRLQGTPQAVEALVRRTAEEDGRSVHVVMEQEPGSSGLAVIDHYRRRVLVGWTFYGERSTGKKADRAQPLASQAEGGNVKLLRGRWNAQLLDELEVFPFGRHDDQVDAASLALSQLCEGIFHYGQPEDFLTPEPPRPRLTEPAPRNWRCMDASRARSGRIWGL
jgi:predicted phage terminase large subunit-like protein